MTVSLEYTPTKLDLAPAASPWTHPRRCPVMGVMYHYDASASDAGGLAWLQNPTIRAMYELVVADDGSWGRLGPADARVWHAGKTRSSDPERLPYPENEANSAFYSISILNSGREGCTAPQMLTAAYLGRWIFEHNGWDPVVDAFRVTGHHLEAWPRGRKLDPIGPNPENPILSLEDIRSLLPMFTNVPEGLP